MSGLQRAVRIVAVLWVVSFLSAVPFAVFTKIHYLPYPRNGGKFLYSYINPLVKRMSFKGYNWSHGETFHFPSSTGMEDLPESAFCAMLDYPENFPLWEVSTCVFFALPMIIMVIMYGRMGLKIRSRTRHTVALGEYVMLWRQNDFQARHEILNNILPAFCFNHLFNNNKS